MKTTSGLKEHEIQPGAQGVRRPRAWLLGLLFVLLGVTGGAIGGEVGPGLIERGWSVFPLRFLLLFAGLGALVGILPGLVGGILAAVLNMVLTDRGTAS